MVNTKSVCVENTRRGAGEPVSGQDATEARRFMYSFKILGLFWFNGQLPDDLAEPIDYVINPNWLHGLGHLSTKRIEALGESELVFICNKIKKPRWVYRSSLRGKLTFSEVPH